MLLDAPPRLIFCLLLVGGLWAALATPAAATMFWNFTPTPTGGIRLEIQFQGIAQPDSSHREHIELILPAETILGGGSSRGDLYFDDTLSGHFLVGGQAVVPLYVRLGNDVQSEQFFILLNRGISTGQAVDIQLVATWDEDNLPYSALRPGTYTAARPRFGNAIISISAVPEPSTSTLIVFVLGTTCATRLRRYRKLREPPRRPAGTRLEVIVIGPSAIS
jgi:hypothetical protein